MDPTETELRKWCVETAVDMQRINPLPDVTATAQKIYDWVKSGEEKLRDSAEVQG